MKLYNTKTELVKFEAGFQSIEMSIVWEVSMVQSRDVVKFLGILVDRRLDWKARIEYLVQKIESFLYFLRSLRKKAGVASAVTP